MNGKKPTTCCATCTLEWQPTDHITGYAQPRDYTAPTRDANAAFAEDFFIFFQEALLLPPPGYLGHSANTPGSFTMSYAKTLFQINSYESVYGLARLHTTYNVDNYVMLGSVMLVRVKSARVTAIWISNRYMR